jgi:hypothetical protein
MNFKLLSIRLLKVAALMAYVQWAHAQGQSPTDATPSAQPTAPMANKVEQVIAPLAASNSALRLVDQEAPGRDAQGNMRIKLIDGGIKLPSKR